MRIFFGACFDGNKNKHFYTAILSTIFNPTQRWIPADSLKLPVWENLSQIKPEKEPDNTVLRDTLE
jgi:hypothetical protein